MKTLRDKLGLMTLIETGTYQGTSTAWAAQHFPGVVTIDIREDFQRETMNNACRNFGNIAFLCGDSRTVLPEVLKGVKRPVAFWLDAHNAGQLFGNGPDDCPIIEELEAILQMGMPHAILIDDAHCFMSPLMYNDWPELAQLKEIASKYGFISGVAHDVIAIVPQRMSDELTQFVSTNPAYLSGAVPVSRFNLTLQMLLSRKVPLKCFAHAVQGPPPKPEFNAEKGNPDITEILDTIYGKMLVPKYDSVQTYGLRSGWAVGHAQIEILIEAIKTRPPGAVFVDVGANIGTYALGLQPHCSMVHAFEPQRLLFYMLCGSVALNGFNNIKCYNYVLSDCVEAMKQPQFDYTKPGSFGSIEFGGDTQRQSIGQERTYDPLKVDYITSAPLDQFSFPRVDLLKIDAEGMDIRVLDGSRATIKHHSPIICIEHANVNKRVLTQKLEDLGYSNLRDIGGDYLCFPEGSQ